MRTKFENRKNCKFYLGKLKRKINSESIILDQAYVCLLMQLPSYHERQVGVPYTISNIEEATDICVASMVGDKAWPQLAFEGCYCACHILVYIPSVFGVIF
jgi:hypothetical protein|tara:strand:- start:400 stop:702 length:303 start_codon:yes stop_codon:yes gene_type:complete